MATWIRGDVGAIETLLDPAVTLRAIQPGPWDCENREQVMQLLRARAAERNDDDPHRTELRRVDDTTYLVSGVAGGDGVATRITIEGGKVIALQQVSTDEPTRTRNPLSTQYERATRRAC